MALRRLEIFDCQMVSRAGIHKLGVCNISRMSTVDREIFILKIICLKIFAVDKFSQFI